MAKSSPCRASSRKGKKNIVTTKDKYTGIRQTGPESLRHFKRTFKRAMKRQISSGTYNPIDPMVIPIRADKQYRSWKEIPKPDAVACIMYMMDVSGSMTDEQKEIVRIEAFWIDTWIKKHYKGVENVYIIHDAEAKEVDEHTFYHTRESAAPRSAPLTSWPTRSSTNAIRRASGTSTPSTSPTATTGATTARTASSSCRRRCCRN